MDLFSLPHTRKNLTTLTSENFTLLNGLSTLTEKLEKSVELLEIPESEYIAREQISEKVYEVLKKYYPDCSVFTVGSTASKLATQNSQLDLLFIPFPGYSNHDFSHLTKSDLPDPDSILSGETLKDVFSKFTEWMHLGFIRVIFRREKPFVKKVSLTPHTTSINLHLADGISLVTIFASNMMFCVTSELFQFFLRLDPRVKPLVMALRYWGVSMGFIRRGFFSNHAFTLLIIFFLQNVNPCVLPPVQHLVRKSKTSRMESGWETAFTTDASLVEKSKNTKTVGELFINFFEYYWNFDFVQNVVCPRSGKILLVQEFKNSKDEKVSSFEFSCVNIQDPFILSANVSKQFPKTITSFKLALLIACQMLQDKKEKYTFNVLFDSNVYQSVLNFHYERYMFGQPFLFPIPLTCDCLSKLSTVSKNPQSLWYERATQAVYDVLQYGLLLECEVIDKISPAKKLQSLTKDDNAKLQALEQSDNKQNFEHTAYGLELLQSIQCTVYSRTYVGRKNVTEEEEAAIIVDDLTGSVLKKEHSISRVLIKKSPLMNLSNPVLCFKWDSYRHASPQIPDIIVMLKPLSNSREYCQVCNFLKAYMSKTVQKIVASD